MIQPTIKRDTACKRTPTQKPTLKMVQLPIFRVQHTDLETFLKQAYGMEVDFLRATGFKAGECPEYTVAVTKLFGDLAQRASAIRDGRWFRDFGLILTVLCIDGLIPAGKYLISTGKQVDPVDTYRILLGRTEDPKHPECLEFKRQHSRDKGFVKMAAVMDATVKKLRQEAGEVGTDNEEVSP